MDEVAVFFTSDHFLREKHRETNHCIVYSSFFHTCIELILTMIKNIFTFSIFFSNKKILKKGSKLNLVMKLPKYSLFYDTCHVAWDSSKQYYYLFYG